MKNKSTGAEENAQEKPKRNPPRATTFTEMRIRYENEQGLAHAKAFYEKYHHFDLRDSYICEDGYKLGKWLRTVRTRHKNGTLQQDVIEQLEAYGYSWDRSHVGPIKDQHRTVESKIVIDDPCVTEPLPFLDIKLSIPFRIGIAHATKFYETYHHLSVTVSYRDEFDYPLGNWLYNLRQKYQQGKLHEEIIRYFDEMDFVWSIRRDGQHYNISEKSVQGLAEAKRYHEKNGHLFVPATYVTEDDFPLGSWLRRVRTSYWKGGLNGQMQAELEQLGYIWDHDEDNWQDCYRCCLHYFQNGSIRSVTEDLRELQSVKGYMLLHWYMRNCNLYARNELNPEHREQFAALLAMIAETWRLVEVTAVL